MPNTSLARKILCITSLIIGFGFISVTAQAALTITPVFIGGEEPTGTYGGGDLETIFAAAAETWEGVFAASEDNWEVSIEFGWGKIGEANWGQEFLIEQGGSNPVRITRSKILFQYKPQPPGFYADPSPQDNSEFPVPMTTFLLPDYPTLNTGRVQTGAAGEVALRIDLLTIALHEIGHALGLDEHYVGARGLESPICQSLQLCTVEITAPRPYAGLQVQLTFGPHLDVLGFNPPVFPLMIPMPTPGQRQLISDLDVLILEQIGAVLPAQASFEMSKNFTDGNTADVEVTLSCNTGLPLVQSQTISANQGVTFIVQNFNNGELDCNVTESDLAGYTAFYLGDNECRFEGVVYGVNKTCEVTNTPTPVELTVNKNWLIDGQGGDEFDPAYRLDLYCDSPIIYGDKQGNSWNITLYDGTSRGISNTRFSAKVVPDWQDGSLCWVRERVYDNAIEISSDCGESAQTARLQINLAQGDSCTVRNTVFFEGIPALGPYGLAILALSMLGMAYAGFRRST